MITLTIEVWPPMPNAARGGHRIKCENATEIEFEYLKTMLNANGVEMMLRDVRKESGLEHRS